MINFGPNLLSSDLRKFQALFLIDRGNFLLIPLICSESLENLPNFSDRFNRQNRAHSNLSGNRGPQAHLNKRRFLSVPYITKLKAINERH